MPPSVLVRVNPGLVMVGVVSLLELLPGVGSVPPEPSSLIVAVLATWVMPAASGLSTVTAKMTDPPPPTANVPTVNRQAVPAGAPFAQLQPGVLAPALKVVFAGTVSLICTPVRPILPVLA